MTKENLLGSTRPARLKPFSLSPVSAYYSITFPLSAALSFFSFNSSSFPSPPPPPPTPLPFSSLRGHAFSPSSSPSHPPQR